MKKIFVQLLVLEASFFLLFSFKKIHATDQPSHSEFNLSNLFDSKLNAPRPNFILIQILKNKKLKDALLEPFIKESASEGVEFLADFLITFEARPQLNDVLVIYNRYLSENSSAEVNLSSRTKDLIDSAIKVLLSQNLITREVSSQLSASCPCQYNSENMEALQVFFKAIRIAASEVLAEVSQGYYFREFISNVPEGRAFSSDSNQLHLAIMSPHLSKKLISLVSGHIDASMMNLLRFCVSVEKLRQISNAKTLEPTANKIKAVYFSGSKSDLSQRYQKLLESSEKPINTTLGELQKMGLEELSQSRVVMDAVWINL